MSSLPLVVGLGEILWDVFPEGPRFGGAPANFACHAAALGARAQMVSAVGNDQLGEQALAELHQRRVETEAVQRHSHHPTGTVTVSLDSQGHASYEFAADTAWDSLVWCDDLADRAARAAAVCFGTLGQRSPVSRDTIQRFVAATPSQALRIFDVNLRPPFYEDSVIRESLKLANVLKLNAHELPVVARAVGFSGQAIELMHRLAERFDLRAVALTLGPQGALLIRGTEVTHEPGVQTRVVDTVGAGDAFAAALALGLLNNRELECINRHACRVAAFVCSQSGATPQLPPELGAPG